MPIQGGDGRPIQYLKDGKWTSEGVVTTGFMITMPNGEEIEIIRDGALVEDERVVLDPVEAKITINWGEGRAAAGGKERAG